MIRLFRIKWELTVILMLLIGSNLLLVLQAHSQTEQNGDKIAQKYIRNVIQLSVKFSNGTTEYGYGFVVGERKNKLYVVTARHVVLSKDPDVETTKVYAQFYTEPGKPYEAVLLQLSEHSLDLSLLEISKYPAGYKWEKKAIHLNPVRKDKVWFIGRNQEWYIPLTHGLISSPASPANQLHIAEISSVRPGTSGAPLFTKNGIVGMVVYDESSEVEALGIETIKFVVMQKWRYPWQLGQTQPDSDKSKNESRPSRRKVYLPPPSTNLISHTRVKVFYSKKTAGKMKKVEKILKEYGAYVDSDQLLNSQIEPVNVIRHNNNRRKHAVAMRDALKQADYFELEVLRFTDDYDVHISIGEP